MAVAAYTQAEKEASKAPDWEIFYSKGGYSLPSVRFEWLYPSDVPRLAIFAFLVDGYRAIRYLQYLRLLFKLFFSYISLHILFILFLSTVVMPTSHLVNCRGDRGTFCHGAHSASRVFSKTIQRRYFVAV